MALIDLLAILPAYLPMIIPIDLRVLRILRTVRIFRIFKINRYTNALKTIGQVFKNEASQLISSTLVVGLLMIIASVLMYNIENAAQPEDFSNAIETIDLFLPSFKVHISRIQMNFRFFYYILNKNEKHC